MLKIITHYLVLMNCELNLTDPFLFFGILLPVVHNAESKTYYSGWDLISLLFLAFYEQSLSLNVTMERSIRKLRLGLDWSEFQVHIRQ